MIAAGDTAALDVAIRAELRRHQVVRHRVSAWSAHPRYAVLVNGRQQGKAGTHREMQQLREDLIVKALVALFASAAG